MPEQHSVSILTKLRAQAATISFTPAQSTGERPLTELCADVRFGALSQPKPAATCLFGSNFIIFRFPSSLRIQYADISSVNVRWFSRVCRKFTESLQVTKPDGCSQPFISIELGQSRNLKRNAELQSCVSPTFLAPDGQCYARANRSLHLFSFYRCRRPNFKQDDLASRQCSQNRRLETNVQESSAATESGQQAPQQGS